MQLKLTRWKRSVEAAEGQARHLGAAPQRSLRGGVSVARGAHNDEGRGRRRRPQPVHLGLAEYSKAPACKADGRDAPRRWESDTRVHSMPTWRNWQTHQVESLAVDQTMRDRGPPSVPGSCASTQTGKAARLNPECLSVRPGPRALNHCPRGGIWKTRLVQTEESRKASARSTRAEGTNRDRSWWNKKTQLPQKQSPQASRCDSGGADHNDTCVAQ